MGCGASASVGGGPSQAQVGAVPDIAVQKDLALEEALVPKVMDEREEGTISTAASSRSASPPDAHQVEELPLWPRKMFLDAQDHPFMIFGVLSFLPWSQRGETMRICGELRTFFNAENVHGEYWRWHCECLCAESFLFLPEAAPRAFSPKAGACQRLADCSVDYQALFTELWPLRSHFVDHSAQSALSTPERFRVSVFCRMRPAPPAALYGGICEELLSAPVTLPLGQRVALLRQRHPELTRAEAMRALLNKECGAAQPLDEDGASEVDATVDDTAGFMPRPKTGASVRPQTGLVADVASTCGTGFNASVLSVESGQSGSVLTVSPGIGIRKWSFADVFGEATTQHHLYETCGRRLAINLMNGKNGSLIVYGQTGSGKTHTVFGPPNVKDGLVPRIADDLLGLADSRRSAGFTVSIGVSIIEVFGNDVTNLLGKTGAAKLCARMGTKRVLDGNYEHVMDDRASFESLLALGEERKRKAHTEMNERSTRAHTIVLLRMRQRAPGQENVVESVLQLVDLGGSERVSKSKANENVKAPGAVTVGDEEVSRVTWQEYYKGRERITETNNINKGLLALKRCVQALNERQKRAQEGRPLVRVPFADSKLTTLLQPALNGEASTSIVVCCSPEDRHAEETVQSLRFGEMCSSVEQDRLESNANDVGAAVAEAVKQIDSQIKEVEEEIRAKEKLEWRKAVRTDVIDEKDTGGTVCNKDEVMELGGAGAVEIAADDGTSKKEVVEHVVWSQVFVGAEAENARREELLKARLRLLGGDGD